MNELFQVRLTGVVVDDGRMLIVKQAVSPARHWSLPGGRLQHGETLEQGILREMKEETRLSVKLGKLLYVCDKRDAAPPLIHMSFLLHRTGGDIRLPSNEFDENPIHDVRMVGIDELVDYGFSTKFQELALAGFPGAGSYVGSKGSIGLG